MIIGIAIIHGGIPGFGDGLGDGVGDGVVGGGVGESVGDGVGEGLGVGVGLGLGVGDGVGDGVVGGGVVGGGVVVATPGISLMPSPSTSIYPALSSISAAFVRLYSYFGTSGLFQMPQEGGTKLSMGMA